MSPRPADIEEPTNRTDLRSSILEFVNEIIYQNGRFLDRYWFEGLAQTQIGAGKRRMCADRRQRGDFRMQYGREVPETTKFRRYCAAIIAHELLLKQRNMIDQMTLTIFRHCCAN